MLCEIGRTVGSVSSVGLGKPCRAQPGGVTHSGHSCRFWLRRLLDGPDSNRICVGSEKLGGGKCRAACFDHLTMRFRQPATVVYHDAGDYEKYPPWLPEQERKYAPDEDNCGSNDTACIRIHADMITSASEARDVPTEELGRDRR